jgi:glycosyltransferase involved in cell wall biosynthesis
MASCSVLFSVDSMDIGGTELNAVRTAELLARRGYTVEVVCLKRPGPLSERYQRAGIPVRYLGLRNLYGPAALSSAAGLVSWLRRKRFDVAHCHDMYSNIFLTACVRLSGQSKVVASQRWLAGLPDRRYRVGNALAFRWADLVLANSPAVASVVETRLGVPPERIAIITNFLEDSSYDMMPAVERERLLAALGVPAGSLVIGSVARLSKVKDHATLLRGFAMVHAQYPHTHLLIIGEGPERRSLEVLVQSLGLGSAVSFAGLLDNTVNLHGLLDISVLTSTSEGFPNTVIEAMAVARPVVATRVGGTVDAVEQGVSGILVSPSAPAELAAELATLVKDPALRLRLGEAAQAVARSRYGQAVVIGQLEELYRRLCR